MSTTEMPKFQFNGNVDENIKMAMLMNIYRKTTKTKKSNKTI